jgi:hypothetical protein
MKSRMPRSPWRGDRLVLDNGCSPKALALLIA